MEFLIAHTIDRKSGRTRLNNKIADEIRKQFAAQGPAITDSIKNKITARMQIYADKLETAINSEINEREERLNQILAQNDEAQYSEQRERLKEIDLAISKQWTEMSELVFGKVLSDAEIQELATDDTDKVLEQFT